MRPTMFSPPRCQGMPRNAGCEATVGVRCDHGIHSLCLPCRTDLLVDAGWHHGEMTDDQLLELISIDPEICHGQPCIRGTRVLVTVILDSLAAGMSEADIVAGYPSLTPEGVRAGAGYGAWLARQEVHPLAPSRR
jgi:uncharacterized protein (DUF433 family)